MIRALGRWCQVSITDLAPHQLKLLHRVWPGPSPAATAYAAQPKAVPGGRAASTHDRVRTDRVDTDGKLTLRVNGKLHRIGIGITHARTPATMGGTSRSLNSRRRRSTCLATADGE